MTPAPTCGAARQARLRHWLAGAAALALTLLLAAPGLHAAAPPPEPGPATLTNDGWTNLFPTLAAVSADSADDAWAAGEYGHLLHYSAGTWAPVDPPVLRGASPVAISMAAPDAGWLTDGSRAFQYDGTTWQERSAGLGANPGLNSLSALARDDAWATTKAPGCPDNSRIFHWDGSQWTSVLPPDSTYKLTTVRMASPTDGWAVGYGCDPWVPVLLHYDGTGWTSLPVPADPSLAIFWGLSITGPDDVWTWGNPQNNTRRAVYHYQAGTWTSWLLPQAQIPYGLYMLDDTQGWVVTTTSIWHWDGQSWTVERTGAGFTGVAGAGGRVWVVAHGDQVWGRTVNDSWAQQWGGPTGQDLNYAIAPSADDAWAVGNAGTILHYTAGAWQPVSTALTDNLYNVQMRSPTDGYAVGGTATTGGVIAHWDGAAWQSVLTTTRRLYGLTFTADDEGWAVGDQGAIWHLTAGTWAQEASPTTLPLRAVAMDSPSHGWAVGGVAESPAVQPVLLEYTGTTWVNRTATLPWNTRALSGLILLPGGAEGWAVGSCYSPTRPILLHLLDGQWLGAGAPGFALCTVTLDSGLTPWAAGVGSAVYYYTVGGWQTLTLPGQNDVLFSLAMAPDGSGWAVGQAGSVFHYTPRSPTATPTALSTPGATATETPLPTETGTPSSTATAPPAPSATNTPVPTATTVPSPTPSDTPPPTDTPPPLTATATASTTATTLPSATATGTAVPPATATPSPLPTGTTVPLTATPSATATAPVTATAPPTWSPAATATSTPVPPSTVTPPPSATAGLPTATPPPSPSPTAAPSGTPVPPSPTASPTPLPPTASPTPCALAFADVRPADYFYAPVLDLACRGVISGYADGTFRPYTSTTRTQLVKIVVLGFGLPINTPATATFADVPPTFPFYAVIETAAAHGILSGYACGGPSEPCDGANRPYFRPYANVTRGQIAKIVVTAARWPVVPPSTPHFADVPPAHPFYALIETAAARGILSGYTCGGPGEPCDAANRPYFRPYADATRGQIVKIVALALAAPP